MTEKKDLKDLSSGLSSINIDRQYDSKLPSNIQSNTSEMQKEMDKTKKELEKIKSWIIKKYPFTQALSILPPQAVKVFVDEEEAPKDTESFMHLYMIVPEEQFKNIPKIKKEIVEEIDKNKDKLKQKIWLQIKTPIDVWENCLDGKCDLTGAVAMSYPLHDTGFLGALRVAEIHKSLVLQKFDKYVVSYVIGGSMVRGDANETSDVDVFIVINDTDVKRMPRLELKERLRGMIYQYIAEATALAGVKNILNVQVYLLTDFWDAVKDAHPVMFTFIRDGVPLYDKGTFLPWKALLRMGKLKPSPEAIDLFMKSSEKTKEMVNRRLLDAMVDVYYGVLNPSQALIMLYGEPPPAPKYAYKSMEEIFVKKEKMLTKADVAILDRAIKLFKAYEHDLKFKVSGKEIDDIVGKAEIYLKKMKDLRKKIEKRSQEKTVEQLHGDIIGLLKTALGNKSQEKLVEEFEKKLVKEGKFASQDSKILKHVLSVRQQFKQGKLKAHEVDRARKEAVGLINSLIEYNQRKELACIDRKRMRIKYKKDGKEMLAEFLISDENLGFLFKENKVYEITNNVKEVDANTVSDIMGKGKVEKEVVIHPNIFNVLKKEIGNFEIVF